LRLLLSTQQSARRAEQKMLTARFELVRDRLKVFSVVVLLLGSLLCLSTVAQQQENNNQQRPRVVPVPQSSTKQPKQSAPNETIEVEDGDIVRVDTQLVNVPAVVLDSHGRPLTNLKAENFIVYEDEQPQQLSNFATAEAPFEVALLLDTSGSTAEQIGLIRKAAASFIAALRQGDRVAIISFNKNAAGGKNFAAVDIVTRLTSNREALQLALERIGSSNGTPLYDGLTRIADEIFRGKPSPEMRGRRALVSLTDGVDSASEAEFEEVKEKLRRAGDVACYFIEVNTEDYVEDRILLDCADPAVLRLSSAQLRRYRINFTPKADPGDYADFCKLGQFERMDVSRKLYLLARKEMNELARNSGGKTFPVADLRDAQAAFAQVAKEIGTQYSLGYYSTNQKQDGSFRSIRVTLRGVKGASVRAREGYVAPKS
jgi:VWFA-related protein